MTQRLFAAFLCGFLLSACSTKHYRRSADKEVARIIAEKTPAVRNMDTNFSIETLELSVVTNFPVFDKAEEAFGAESEMERGARIVSLDQALEIAVRASENYQNQKELVYLQALALTLDRHKFTPIFSGGVKAVNTRTPLEIKRGVDTVIEDEHHLRIEPSAGMDLLLRTGGRITTDFTTDFLRFLTGDPRVTTSSKLAATLTQPLLRGDGYKIAIENLTQAERDVLYALRDFTRFRKEFSVDVASAFYDVLQNRDAVRNSWRGLQNFKENVARERAFAEEGQRSQASLDQLKQAELQTESRWINAVRTYRQSLDQFKVRFGWRVDSRIVLDETELTRLKITHPNISIADAVKVAMVSRLDLDTRRDRVEDAGRKIKVAANGLLPQLDVIAGLEIDNKAATGFPSPDWQKYRWNAGLDLDLPFDRKLQRNSYRSSLITFERAKRELNLATNTIQAQIADEWRNLDQAKRNFEISELGVKIAERRVEEQRLLQELGRGTSRDLVDAQNDLIDSKNQRTAALVNHTVARLRFYRDMGILWIKENGQWDENPNAIDEKKNP
jgi:outer membrane protein TolC